MSSRESSIGPVTRSEQRIHMRFDKLFQVVVGSELFGDTVAVARNISTGGMLVQMAEPLPLGSVVTIVFVCERGERGEGPADELVARAEVKHHYCLNFQSRGAPDEVAATRAMGLRFIDFDDALPLDLPGHRFLH